MQVAAAGREGWVDTSHDHESSRIDADACDNERRLVEIWLEQPPRFTINRVVGEELQRAIPLEHEPQCTRRTDLCTRDLEGAELIHELRNATVATRDNAIVVEIVRDLGRHVGGNPEIAATNHDLVAAHDAPRTLDVQRVFAHLLGLTAERRYGVSLAELESLQVGCPATRPHRKAHEPGDGGLEPFPRAHETRIGDGANRRQVFVVIGEERVRTIESIR